LFDIASQEILVQVFDRILSCLLILGGIGHTLGSLRAYKSDPMMLLWSLSASLFVFFFSGINLVRAGRPDDSALAWLCLAAGIGWTVASLRFGALIGNIFDFRPLIFVILTLGLCAMCVRTLLTR
jgi:hypothetical protein